MVGSTVAVTTDQGDRHSRSDHSPDHKNTRLRACRVADLQRCTDGDPRTSGRCSAEDDLRPISRMHETTGSSPTREQRKSQSKPSTRHCECLWATPAPDARRARDAAGPRAAARYAAESVPRPSETLRFVAPRSRSRARLLEAADAGRSERRPEGPEKPLLEAARPVQAGAPGPAARHEGACAARAASTASPKPRKGGGRGGRRRSEGRGAMALRPTRRGDGASAGSPPTRPFRECTEVRSGGQVGDTPRGSSTRDVARSH